MADTMLLMAAEPPFETRGYSDSDSDSDPDESQHDEASAAAPVAPPAVFLRKQRSSVSAECSSAIFEFQPPVYPKTEDEAAGLTEILKLTMLFKDLDPCPLRVIVHAMQLVVAHAEQRIIQEGTEGDHMYVIASGVLNCIKVVDGEEQLVRVYQAGECFGELALLYNAPRAASIVACEESYLWMLDRQTFNYIVKDSAMRRHELNEAILRSIPLLQTLTEQNLKQLADVLRRETYQAGAQVIEYQGTDSRFYLVQTGELRAWKPVDGEWQDVMHYTAGTYFGELALLDDQVRQAAVVAETDCTLFVVDSFVFRRLLGPLQDEMRRLALENYSDFVPVEGALPE